jgi:hypothetical protein
MTINEGLLLANVHPEAAGPLSAANFCRFGKRPGRPITLKIIGSYRCSWTR